MTAGMDRVSLPSRICGAALVLGAALLLANPLSAARLPIQGDLGALGWREHKLPGTAPNRFLSGPSGVVEIIADDSASFLYKDVSAMSQGRPILRWRWRVDQSSGITRLSQRGGDDRPVALHVWFPVEDQEQSLWSQAVDAIGDGLGVPLTGWALTYVWGGTEPVGTLLDNPYLEEEGALIVLRSGDAPQGRWFSERVDLDADFRRAFGVAPPPARYVAISADFDDTMGRSRAAIADIVFGHSENAADTPTYDRSVGPVIWSDADADPRARRDTSR